MDQIVRQPAHRRRLDYVFIGSTHAYPHAHCHVRAAGLAYNHPTGTTRASDHFGVVLVVGLPGAGTHRRADVMAAPGRR